MNARTSFLIACLALGVAAAPASATQTMVCAAKGKNAPMVSLAIGHAAEPGVASAYFQVGGKEVKVAVSQSWLDRSRVWVNLGDPDLMEVLVRLRATGRNTPRGTLSYKGRTWNVRCSEGD